MKNAISSFNQIKEDIKSIKVPEFEAPEINNEPEQKDSFEALISQLKSNLEESSILQDKVKPI